MADDADELIDELRGPRDPDLQPEMNEIWSALLRLFDGDEAEATTWLGRPQRGLGGAVPRGLAQTEDGRAEVLRAILRIEHGVFS